MPLCSNAGLVCFAERPQAGDHVGFASDAVLVDLELSVTSSVLIFNALAWGFWFSVPWRNFGDKVMNSS
jgi:hypothetical protein